MTPVVDSGSQSHKNKKTPGRGAPALFDLEWGSAKVDLKPFTNALISKPLSVPACRQEGAWIERNLL